MKTIKGTVFLTSGIITAIVAVGMGDTIMNLSNGWQMLFCAFASIVLLAVSLVFCALGVEAENSYACKENRKVKRVPTHTNEWRGAR